MIRSFKIKYLSFFAICLIALTPTPTFALPRTLVKLPIIVPPTTNGTTSIPTKSSIPIAKQTLTTKSSYIKFNSSKIVTDSYMRMNEPNVLVNLATKVESGAMPLSSLQYLAGKSAAAALVQVNWRSPAMASIFGNSAAIQSSSGGPSWNIIAQKMPILYTQGSTLFWPSSISLNEMKTGTVIKQEIDFIAPSDGSINVSLGTGSYGCVKITNLFGYSGQWYASASAQGALVPALSKLAIDSGTLPVQAGEMIGIDVEISSENSTKFNTNINVYGTSGQQGWKASIPVSGLFTILGPLNTLVAIPDRNIACLAGETIQMPLQLINLSSATATGTVTFANLPSGVTVSPVNFSVPASGTANETVTFVVAQNTAEDIGVSVDLTAQPIAGATAGHANITFSIFDPIHEYDLGNDIYAGSVIINAPVVGICSDGTYYFNCLAEDSPDIIGDSFRFGFGYFDQDNTANGVIGSDSFGASAWSHDAYKSESLSGTSKWVYDNYLGAVTLTPFAFLQVDPSDEYQGGPLQLSDPAVTLNPF